VTLGRNLIAGLGRVTGDVVAFIEDDDWYAPTYLETMLRLLDTAPLVGEGLSRQYNVRTRTYRNCCNAAHACLAGTLCRSWYIPKIIEVVKRCGPRACYDLSLWRAFEHSILTLNTRLYVGMKGLPGRAGIATGHTDGTCANPDPDIAVLHEWIGDDAREYERFSC
jgi:hypothetical protein